MLRVCDLMHKGVSCCYPEETVKSVAKMIQANQFRSVVVVHQTGEVWGLISILDLVRHWGEDLEKLTAEDIMRPYKIDVDPQWPVERAIEIMRNRKIEHLIIIDPHAGPKRPIAILTSFDIILHMSQIETGSYERMLRVYDGMNISSAP
jgi:predicted transcriptional regulator